MFWPGENSMERQTAGTGNYITSHNNLPTDIKYLRSLPPSSMDGMGYELGGACDFRADNSVFIQPQLPQKNIKLIKA